ncbi:protein SMG9 [Xenopus laevis]|uniref:Nonsense-mediated mRNA decay factor SMG9 n=1 Tax=Xenopus laevis TaxID=8355 RepID=SMG9_XENLA|nr:nonsense-mediated mRNA decay factor SMG9 [Xenopus laevis]Q05AW9.1 RecName: Full=Nonsense-mediated mRNA decay factor SMG9; AltName: Full=Protein smg-9 homolog [Xenopus laevis]AAI23226.1 MGC154467 protein [Xenopus laevis]
MSDSGHSQPNVFIPGRNRRRRWMDQGPAGNLNLSEPGREKDSVLRDRDQERWEGNDEGCGYTIQKTPIILAKPASDRAKAATPAAPAPIEKPIVLMKAREEGKPTAPAEGAAVPPAAAVAKVEKEGQRPTQPVYQIQNRGMGAAASAGGSVDPVVGQAKLLPPQKMKHSIKLVDEYMNWCDSAIEFLLDQTDVLVVGVLGLQGTGKSTLMSLLSANSPDDDQRSYVFRMQSQEVRERAGNQTSGIDFFISQERIIFLDTQPILSPAILDHLINNDRKLPPEYNLPHTYVEMQSLQIAAFLFTVCHVVIVVQDWFTDFNLYRFLQTAEMLKPSTPSPSHESSGSSGSDEGIEYYPHIVFVQNKSKREDFCPRTLKQMHTVMDKLMLHSHLRYKGTLSMLDCNIFPGLPYDFVESEVNLFLIPTMESDADETISRAGTSGIPLFSLLPAYKGHPSFHSLVSRLRSQIMSMSRPQLSHTILTEKNWFHYAARIWDGVKKSSALSEYSRLLG